MLKLALGTLLAAIAMFAWGFFFYGSKAIDHFGHVTLEQEAVLLEAFKANLSADAIYILPDESNGTAEEVMARAAPGPVALINYHSGPIPPMATTLIMGFVHILITAAILAVFMTLIAPAAKTYADRLKVIAVAALAAAVFAHLGNPIWWHYPWGFSAMAALYDFVSYVMAGAILAYFVPARM